VPDLILLDVVMPVMDGRRFVEFCGPNCPPLFAIILLTARNTLDDKLKGLQAVSTII